VPAIFVDTGGFYAAADEGDRNHGTARVLFEAHAIAGDLVTSDYVFVETCCLVRARLGRQAAMRFWDALQTGVVRVHGVTSEDIVEARKIAASWPDQDFSLVDCTSFALMERLDIDQALAFDAHFRTYRFGPQRKRAFRVVQ
jgi:predicted nucleic acid-binding protein